MNVVVLVEKRVLIVYDDTPTASVSVEPRVHHDIASHGKPRSPPSTCFLMDSYFTGY